MLKRFAARIFQSIALKSPKLDMEVTKKNFAEKLPLVQKAIQEASFIAIDGEFTGLDADGGTRQSILDTPEDRYLKSRQNVNKFLLVQFGLVTFHYNSKKDKFTNRAFNFYVWPRQFSRSAPDIRFLCQSSSIDFLVSQNFDFNKVFRDGISYLRPCDADKIRANITERQLARKNMTPNTSILSPNGAPKTSSDFVVPEDQIPYVNEITLRVENWLKDSASKNTLRIDNPNPFQRRLLYNTIKPKFSDQYGFHMETIKGKDKDRHLLLTKASLEEQQQLERERDQSEFIELEEALGFSKIIQTMVESKKPIIGHNCFLDLLYTIQQFIAPLPEDYQDFKSLISQKMPNVFDTKLMATTTPLRDDIENSTLENMIKTLEQAPFKLPKIESRNDIPGYSLEDKAEKYHEAGFDAFVTGLCFIAMSNRLANIKEKSKKDNVWPNDEFLAPFVNKINMHRILDIPYLDLAAPDLEPNRDHVFHISFPDEWKTPDILNLFAPFGSVQVSWISDTSAYVCLREHVPNAQTVVMSTLNCSSIYKITPYAKHKELQLMEQELNRELSQKAMNNSGITPMLEQASPFVMETPSPASIAVKKRSASPDTESFKRSKSISEVQEASSNETPSKNKESPTAKQQKLFEEQSWD